VSTDPVFSAERSARLLHARGERDMFRFPRVYWMVALLAAVLALPSVLADFYCDDQGMVLRLEGAPSAVPGPFHLYTFLSGEPGERRLLVDHGPLPWWTVKGLRLSFFRPL
jgi:hypothetical protein